MYILRFKEKLVKDQPEVTVVVQSKTIVFCKDFIRNKMHFRYIFTLADVPIKSKHIILVLIKILPQLAHSFGNCKFNG